MFPRHSLYSWVSGICTRIYLLGARVSGIGYSFIVTLVNMTVAQGNGDSLALRQTQQSISGLGAGRKREEPAMWE